MFSKTKENDVVSGLDETLSGLPEFISAVSPVERAASLAVANAMLISGATRWGKHFSHSPMKLDRDTVLEALDILADHASKLREALAAAGGRSKEDPYLSACKWELVAVRVVMATCACSLSKEYADMARKSWKILSAARRRSSEAVTSLLEYSRAYGLPAIPVTGNRKPDKAYLTALATNMPPMFRTTRKQVRK